MASRGSSPATPCGQTARSDKKGEKPADQQGHGQQGQTIPSGKNGVKGGDIGKGRQHHRTQGPQGMGADQQPGAARCSRPQFVTTQPGRRLIFQFSHQGSAVGQLTGRQARAQPFPQQLVRFYHGTNDR